MQTTIGHIVFRIDGANVGFYRDLFAFLGWSTIMDGDAGPGIPMLGVAGNGGFSAWFEGSAKKVANDYDGPGMNHIAIGAASIADVDATAAHLTSVGVKHLFETPRHRPDFAMGPDQTYYQVMFESPDRILFEVVYTGPK